MKQILLFLFIIFLSCSSEDKSTIGIPPNREIKNEDKLFLGTGNDFDNATFEYSPSLNKYCCFYNDTSKLLIISFGWGSGTSGEGFTLIAGDSLTQLSMKAGGCGLFETYNYLTQYQALILKDSNFNELDTIKGYLEYIGVQDVVGMKDRFRKYDGQQINSTRISMHYFDTLTPRTAAIIGNFALPKCIHSDSTESEYLEYHKWMIEDAKTKINGY